MVAGASAGEGIMFTCVAQQLAPGRGRMNE